MCWFLCYWRRWFTGFAILGGGSGCVWTLPRPKPLPGAACPFGPTVEVPRRGGGGGGGVSVWPMGAWSSIRFIRPTFDGNADGS
uniref:WGS project CBMG000000000 data, contig CS5907-c000070 n=1 Tax=Fusarium acuminatum CS5907 TaxID=1318461 RepID=A0A096PDW0_9HYPO|nr:unnamed protein product [Fusarium acuminatum CS5907]